MHDRFEREERLPHPIDDVWEALTDADSLSEWLGEPVDADPRPGGGLAVGEPGEDGARTGFFEEVDPGEHRLSFWWHRDGEEATRVEISLAEEGEGTRLLIVESRPLAVLDATGALIDGWAAERGGPQMSAVATLV